MSEIQSAEVRFLDPRKVELVRDAFDRLRLTIDGDEVHERVKVARAFPTSDPDRYLSFLSQEGSEIGMVIETKKLDPASRRVLDEELDLLYYKPILLRIFSVEGQHGATTWKVTTDRGAATILVKDRGDIRRLAGHRVLFTDVHGLKYDIPDLNALDERSRTLLENEI